MQNKIQLKGKAVLLIMLLLQCFNINAQSSYDDINLNIIPPSPDPSAIEKFVEHPVSFYTGTPKIDIPLFNINQDRLNVNVSLSYHASGVKVDEIPSRIGSGWALNAGGVISRSVRGYPDEFHFNYGCDPEYGGSPQCHAYGYFHMVGKDPSDVQDRYDKFDTNPDLFYFSFPGGSGKFIFTKDRSVVFFEDNNFQFTPTFDENYNLDKFSITTDKGIKYTFGTYEGAYMGSNCFEGHMARFARLSWYLTRVDDLIEGGSITYEYDEIDNYQYPSTYNDTFSYGDINNNRTCGIPYSQERCSSSLSIVDAKRISKISFLNGSIEFDANLARQDIEGDYAITNISLNDASGNLLKKFNLDHEHYSNTASSGAISKRLFLKSITEEGQLGNSKPPYYFHYKNPELLPERTSAEKDIWGYYNANGATETYPDIFVYPAYGKNQLAPIASETVGYTYKIDGNDRSANENVLDYGVLEKIEYPTGGYTEYEYEAHQFDHIGSMIGGGLRIARIKSFSSNEISEEPIISEYSYEQGVLPGILPQYASLMDYDVYNSKSAFEDNLIVFSVSQSTLGSNSGSYIGYGKVIETKTDGSDPLGRTEYYYSNPVDLPAELTYDDTDDQYCSYVDNTLLSRTQYPFYTSSDKSVLRGKLLDKRVYNSSNQLVKRVENDYRSIEYLYEEFSHLFPQGSPAGRKIDAGFPIYTKGGSGLLSEKTSHIVAEYRVKTERNILRSTTEYFYANGEEVDNITTFYNYNFDGYLIGKSRLSESEEYFYPTDFDYSSSSDDHPNNLLLDKNYLGLKLLINRYKDDKLIGSSIRTRKVLTKTISFFDFHKLLPAATYKLAVSENTTLPQINDVYNPPSSYYKTIDFIDYDFATAKALTVWTRDGVTRHYSWSADNGYVYPAAEAINAYPNQFASADFENSNYDNWSYDLDRCDKIAEAYSGNFSLRPLSEEIYTDEEIPAGNYILGLAIKNYQNLQTNPSYEVKIDGFPIKSIYSSNEWTYHEIELTVDQAQEITIFSTDSPDGILYDAITLKPVEGQISKYEYKPLVGLQSSTNSNGVTNYYLYDDFGRLQFIKDQDGNIIKAYDYKYDAGN